MRKIDYLTIDIDDSCVAVRSDHIGKAIFKSLPDSNGDINDLLKRTGYNSPIDTAKDLCTNAETQELNKYAFFLYVNSLCEYYNEHAKNFQNRKALRIYRTGGISEVDWFQYLCITSTNDYSYVIYAFASVMYGLLSDEGKDKEKLEKLQKGAWSVNREIQEAITGTFYVMSIMTDPNWIVKERSYHYPSVIELSEEKLSIWAFLIINLLKEEKMLDEEKVWGINIQHRTDIQNRFMSTI